MRFVSLYQGLTLEVIHCPGFITATFQIIDFSFSKYGANPDKDLLQIFLRNPYSDEMRNEIRKVFGYIYPKNDDDLKLVKKYGFQLPMPYRVASEKLGISVCEDYVKNHHTDIVCTQK